MRHQLNLMAQDSIQQEDSMGMQDLTAEEVTTIVKKYVLNWEDYETEDDCISDNMDVLFEHLWEDELDDEPLEEYEFDEELIDE